MQKVLEIRNVTKTFKEGALNGDYKVALDDISLDINKGDFLTVIGGNGSGKTTLLNVITGALRPDSGNIIINGEDITSLQDYKRSQYFGIVFQDPMLGTAANMSLEENLAIASRRTKRKTLRWGFSKQNRIRFKEQLSLLNLGLENRLEDRIGLLSGGQRQAVTLLMATINNPQVLLLDEHTAALDPKTAQTVLNITNELVQENELTTIMITHNLNDAIRYGNRLIMLDNGRIILDVAGDDKDNLNINELIKLFHSQDLATVN